MRILLLCFWNSTCDDIVKLCQLQIEIDNVRIGLANFTVRTIIALQYTISLMTTGGSRTYVTRG